jgi:hypothetical protein
MSCPILVKPGGSSCPVFDRDNAEMESEWKSTDEAGPAVRDAATSPMTNPVANIRIASRTTVDTEQSNFTRQSCAPGANRGNVFPGSGIGRQQKTTHCGGG